MAFKRYLRSFSNASAGALASKTIFKMYCRSFFIYLAIKKLNVSKAAKEKVKDRALVIKALENLSGLFKLKDLDSKKAKEIGERLVLPKQDLVAIILFERQDDLSIKNLKAMRYPTKLGDPLIFEQIEL